MRKIPMRTCVVTREKLPKRDLVRVVRSVDGVIIDPTGKVNGRGAYLKIDKDVFEKARSSKILDKHLETVVPDSIYDDLNKILEK